MVKGVKALRRRFARIPIAIVEEVEAELDTVGRQLTAEMKSLAPKEDGDLIASIGFARRFHARGGYSVKKLKSGTAVGRVGITVFAGLGLGVTGLGNHAVFQEFGTKNMEANPYFFPVWRSNRSRVKARLSRAVTRAVKKSRK